MGEKITFDSYIHVDLTNHVVVQLFLCLFTEVSADVEPVGET